MLTTTAEPVAELVNMINVLVYYVSVPMRCQNLLRGGIVEKWHGTHQSWGGEARLVFNPTTSAISMGLLIKRQSLKSLKTQQLYQERLLNIQPTSYVSTKPMQKICFRVITIHLNHSIHLPLVGIGTGYQWCFLWCSYQFVADQQSVKWAFHSIVALCGFLGVSILHMGRLVL